MSVESGIGYNNLDGTVTPPAKAPDSSSHLTSGKLSYSQPSGRMLLILLGVAVLVLFLFSIICLALLVGVDSQMDDMQGTLDDLKKKSAKLDMVEAKMEGVQIMLEDMRKNVVLKMGGIERNVNSMSYLLEMQGLGIWCYRIVTQPQLSWTEAQISCLSQGGYLAEPMDEVAINFTTKHIFEYTNRMWLGANDVGVDGSWMWNMSRKAVEAANWAPTGPSLQGGDCLEIGNYPVGMWSGAPCDQPAGYVCQKTDLVCDETWLRGYRQL